MKKCSKCRVEKDLDAFYFQRGCALDRHPMCKECTRAARKRDRLENPEKYRAIDKARYAKEREMRRGAARQWYAANAERGKATRRAHYQANRDTYAGYSAKRKATKRGVERQPYTRREIYDRDGGRCQLCGTSLPYELNGFEIDHIVPLSLGGPDMPANLQLACRPCNRAKWTTVEGQIHLAL